MFSKSNEIWHIGRGRWVMHENMPYDLIQDRAEGHKTLTVWNSYTCLVSVSFTNGAGKWLLILKLKHNIYIWSGHIFDTCASFYRAKHSGVRYCHGKLSVHPSVTLVDCDHTRWNSSKIISRLIGPTFLVSADPNIMDLLQREHT